MRRVVITGLGALTSIGNNHKDFWANLIAGKSGAAKLTRFDTEGFGCHIGCEIKDYVPADNFSKGDLRRLDRFIQYALIAGREANADAGLDPEKIDPTRVGVMVGAGIGGMESLEEACHTLATKGSRRVTPFIIPKLIPNMASGHLSIELGWKGPNIAVATACATGTHSIGDSWDFIRYGQADVMLAGGTEAAITPIGVSGFANMKALTSWTGDPTQASRPFDSERSGFVIGEGAGVVVLEELEHAKKRGAHIYAEVCGYGATGDAFHMTAPDPEASGGTRSMVMCLESGGIDVTEVNHLNAHGTSTPLNDKLETMATKASLGEEQARKVAITSNKSMVGHSLGAAGGIEAVALAKTIEEGIVPPTINYENPDPDCDLDYTPNEAREMEINVGMSNSLGFGGHNGTIAFRKFKG